MHAGVDFETFYSLDYSIWSSGSYGYIHDERFHCYLVAIHSPTYSYCGDPIGVEWDKIIDMDWVSHNMSFDAMVARKLGIPLPKNWYCTADMSVYFHAPRTLKDACWQLMSHKISKEYRGTAKGKQWPDEYSEEDQAQVIEAGKADAEACWTLWERFGKFWPEKERKLSVLTAEMGWRGVQVDTELLDRNIDALVISRWNSAIKLPWVDTEDDTVYSRKQLKLMVDQVNANIKVKARDDGVEPELVWCPSSLAQDSEERERWETEYGDRYPWVGAMRDWMKANCMYRKLLKIRSRLTPDGRFPYSLFYFGAHTGRWAGSGGFNMQNLNNTTLFLKKDGWTVVWPVDGEPVVPDESMIGINLRAHFIPKPGKKFIVCDLAQIEPRVGARLVGDEEFLDYVRSGLDPYSAHARTMGWRGDELEGDERKGYKAQAIGLTYGCWVTTFIRVAWDLCGLRLDEAQAKRSILSFRKAKHMLVDQWEELDESLWDAVRKKETYTVVLPNGRKLEYFNLHRKIANPRNQIIGSAVRGGKSVPWYGAKVWENVVQATSRDIFAEHLLALDARYPESVVLQSHDEAVLEVSEDVTVKEVEDIMSTCPDWLPNTPVASKGFETMYYKKG